jgi:hypothetical protein
VWERNGFVLWQRLERERFHWPRADGATMVLSGQQLNWLLDGFDLARWRPAILDPSLRFEQPWGAGAVSERTESGRARIQCCLGNDGRREDEER